MQARGIALFVIGTRCKARNTWKDKNGVSLYDFIKSLAKEESEEE